MDLRFSILTGLLFVSQISAQELKLDILAPSIGIRQDSVIVSLKMMTKISDLDPKSQVRLTPILKSGAHDISLPAVVLNGGKLKRFMFGQRYSTNEEASPNRPTSIKSWRQIAKTFPLITEWP